MWMRMYSGSFIGEARKKSLRSQVKKRAPSLASEITLLRSSLVSRSDAAGEPVSKPQSSLSPPTTTRMRQGSVFLGR